MNEQEVQAFFTEQREVLKRELEAGYKLEIEQAKARSNKIARELERAKANSLPQCAEPPEIHKHHVLGNQFKFVADQRTTLEKLAVTLAAYNSDDDEDIKTMKTMISVSQKKSDIRLSALRAASSASTRLKGEFVAKYEDALLQKINETAGKYSTGAKSFAVVQQDIADSIDTKLLASEKTAGSNSGGRNRAGRGGGFGARGGADRGGRGGRFGGRAAANAGLHQE